MRSRRKLSEEEIAGFQRERRINRRSTIVSFIAIIGFILISLPFLMNTPTPLTAMKKADQQREVPRLSLSAVYYQGEDIEPIDIVGQAQDGKDLVFVIDTIRPIYISLATSINGAEPQVVFHRTRVPPGQKRLIEKAGTPYIYRLDKTIQSARFCVLDASDFEHLQLKASDVRTTWRQVEAAACVQLR